MLQKRSDTDSRQVRTVTYLGVVTNIVLSAIKFAVGSLGGSMALVADGLHSLSDMVTDLVVLIGTHYGAKKPDAAHPYGHGRMETVAAGFVAIVLVFVGGAMIYKASMAIARSTTLPDQGLLPAAVIWVAIVSIFAKEALYRVTRNVAVKVHSTALYANAYHHRSDAGSSVAVVIGVVATRFGFAHGDHVAAVVVGLMVILAGVRIIGHCFDEFSERAVDTETIEQIKDIIVAEQRIRHWHNLRTRTTGREIFLDLHILVDPQLNITDAHEIAEALESAMHDQIVRPVNITVHVEPDVPELRK